MLIYWHSAFGWPGHQRTGRKRGKITILAANATVSSYTLTLPAVVGKQGANVRLSDATGGVEFGNDLIMVSEDSSNATTSITHKAPTTVETSYSMTWPAALGSNGQFLKVLDNTQGTLAGSPFPVLVSPDTQTTVVANNANVEVKVANNATAVATFKTDTLDLHNNVGGEALKLSSVNTKHAFMSFYPQGPSGTRTAESVRPPTATRTCR